MYNTASVNREEYEYVAHGEPKCWHDDEVNGHQFLGMVCQERTHRLARWFLRPDHVLRNSNFATTIPSFASSPTMCGEPHAGFMVDIVRISSLTSSGMDGLPGSPRWERRAQCFLNRLRCHRITVFGLMNISASFQSGQIRESRLHRTLSTGRIFGLLTLR